MDEDKIRKVEEIYTDFKSKFSAIKEKKGMVLKTYRTKIELTRIEEIRSFLQKIFI